MPVRRRRAAVAGASLLLLVAFAASPARAARGWCPEGVLKLEGIGRACRMPNGLYQLEGDQGTGRLIHGADAPDAFPAESAEAVAATPSEPACVTDPAEHQVIVTYAYPSGYDLSSTRLGQIRDLVREVNGRFEQEGAEFDVDADLRVRCDSGNEIAVLPQLIPTASSTTFTGVVDALEDLGGIYRTTRYKHWVWYEGTGGGAAGTGHLFWDDDLELNNLNNASTAFGSNVSTFAVQWGRCCNVGADGYFSSTTWMHELAHNLGAVQGDEPTVQASPNSSGDGGHCTDDRDVMCYPDGGDRVGGLFPPFRANVCTDREHFDCNHDDYFNPAPAPGSYLATHWNLASCFNRFLSFSHCGGGAQSVAFQAASSTVSEAAGSASVTVTRANGSAGIVGVSYRAAAGSAASGEDFVSASGVLSFSEGVTSRQISVPLLDDGASEDSESFTIALSLPTGGAVLGAPATHTVTLLDDEPAPQVLSFQSAGAPASDEAELTKTIHVVRSGGTVGTASASWQTAGLEQEASGAVEFAHGVASAPVTFPIDDAVFQGDRTISVALSAPIGASLGTYPVTSFTLIDDEVSPRLRFAATSRTVSETAGTIAIVVERLGTTAGTATASIVPGGSLGGNDADVPSSVFFAEGETTAVVEVAIIDDPFAEGPETLALSLASPVGATLEQPTRMTITVGPSDQQPDLHLSRSADGGFVGIDVYSTNGGGQGLTMSPPRGAPGVAFLRLQNDGNIAQSMKLRGVRADSALRVRYFFGRTTTDLTSKVLSSAGYNRWLVPGDAVLVRVELTFTRWVAAATTRTATVMGSWIGDRWMRDLATLTLRRR